MRSIKCVFLIYAMKNCIHFEKIEALLSDNSLFLLSWLDNSYLFRSIERELKKIKRGSALKPISKIVLHIFALIGKCAALFLVPLFFL